VLAKYGNQSAWADSTVQRLHSWNFNTLGSWSDSVVVAKGLPYTRMLAFVGSFGSWLAGTFPDVFDPAWEAWTLQQAQTLCAPVRNDPTLIGYFIDNEVRSGSLLSK
jgi:hypothetical protein